MSKAIYRELSDSQKRVLEEQRAAIEELRAQVFASSWFGRPKNVFTATQKLLDRGLIPPELQAYQEAVGVIVGDEIVARAAYRWLSVEFSGNEEPSVCHPEKSIFVSPISSILKRFDRGEVRIDLDHYVREAIKACEAAAENPEVEVAVLSR